MGLFTPSPTLSIPTLAAQLVEPARSTAREGQLDIHTTGTCFVIWDNTFSWINSKDLNYHLSLRSKEDIEKERIAKLAKLAEDRKKAAAAALQARREARAAMVTEFEGKLAEMTGLEHAARKRLAEKQEALKDIERTYLAAKAGLEAVEDEVRRAPRPPCAQLVLLPIWEGALTLPWPSHRRQLRRRLQPISKPSCPLCSKRRLRSKTTVPSRPWNSLATQTARLPWGRSHLILFQRHAQSPLSRRGSGSRSAR